MLALKRAAAAACRMMHGMDIKLTESKVGDSARNDLAALAAREIKRQVRTLKHATECIHGVAITT